MLRKKRQNLLFLTCTQASCFMQQASRPSQGFSPGHPLYKSPQYFPYLKNGGTIIQKRKKKEKKHKTKRNKIKLG
jgi:hypothetical protein